MLQACNTGHEGSMSTVHANGANENGSPSAAMVAQGRTFPQVKWTGHCVQRLTFIIMIWRSGLVSRRISGVYEALTLSVMNLVVVPLWEWERDRYTSDGTFVGEYRKINEISDEI